MRSRDVVSGRLTLQLTDFKTQGVDMRKATIELRGNELRHNLTVHTEGTPVSVDAKSRAFTNACSANWAGALADSKSKLPTAPSYDLKNQCALAYVPTSTEPMSVSMPGSHSCTTVSGKRSQD